jgi:outer membrane receptor protein involved in Fe transport
MKLIKTNTAWTVSVLTLKAGLLGTCACLATSPVFAQSAPPAADQGSVLQEIVVTAEKRASTVQKTPISMTAISGQDISNRGALDFDKLAQDVPGISARTSGPGQTEFEMRGLSSSGGASPTVGFYLDETPLTAASFTQNGKVVIDPDLYDVNRVEVLRGPQGTLYGSGSMGGTIKLITNQPNLDKFEASADVSMSGTAGGDRPNNAENLMVNIPLAPGMLAVRVVGSLGYDTGWIDRIVTGTDGPTDWINPNPATRWNVLSGATDQVNKDVNSAKTGGFRVTVTAQPVSNLTITPMFMYQRTSQDGYSAYDSDPGTMAHYQPFNTPESISDDFRLGSLVVKYDTSGVEFTSATAYWQRKENQFQDATENLATTFGISPYTDQGGLGESINNELDTSRQFSEEFRVASNNSSRFQWLAGVFYQDFRSEFDLTEPTPGLIPIDAPQDGANLITIDEPTTIKQIAVFGEASYQILDSLKLTAGLRYYHFKTTASSFQNGFLFDGTDLYDQTVPLATSNSGVNPKVNLSWTPQSNLLVYATVSKGFRPAGVNQPVSDSPNLGCPASFEKLGITGAPLTYQSDSVWNYELGEKARLWDGRITFNSDGYYEHWSNVQNLVYLSCGFTFTGNAATAEVYGGEAELAVKLVRGHTSRDGLSLNANAGYAHAQFTADSPSTGIVSGDPMLNIPRFTFSGSLNYGVEVGHDMLAAVQVNNNYVGSRTELTLFAGSPETGEPGYQPLPSYDLTDARISLSKDRWTVAVFANNVFNKHAELSYLNINSFNLYSYNRVVTNQPRTIGVDLSVKY